MSAKVQPGDLLGFDPECVWLVLAVDGERLLCADLKDDLRGGWLSPKDPRALDFDAAAAVLARMGVAADRLKQQAARMEEEARANRAMAAEIEGNAQLVRRLRAARDAR